MPHLVPTALRKQTKSANIFPSASSFSEFNYAVILKTAITLPLTRSFVIGP